MTGAVADGGTGCPGCTFAVLGAGGLPGAVADGVAALGGVEGVALAGEPAGAVAVGAVAAGVVPGCFCSAGLTGNALPPAGGVPAGNEVGLCFGSG